MQNQVDQIRKQKTSIKMGRYSGVGEVGIFWFFNGRVIHDSVPFTQGEEYGDFVNGRSDHCSFWRDIQRRVPALAMLEYDQVPRGRVVYRKKDATFLVYGSEQFIGSTVQKGLVADSFNLPLKKTVFKTDEHYSNISGMLEEERAVGSVKPVPTHRTGNDGRTGTT